MTKNLDRRGIKGVFWLLRSALIVLITIYLVWAFDSRRGPELKPWHRVKFENEYYLKDVPKDFNFHDYLKKEAALFAEISERVILKQDATVEDFNRYTHSSVSNPLRYPKNWNRTYEMIPKEISGGILLLHGLSDSPYSLRKIGELFFSHNITLIG